jgi:bleomycin hydrolase
MHIKACCIASGFLIFWCFHVPGQTEDSSNFQFRFMKKLKTTPVENQYRSNTCWSFSVLSMLETELLEQGKGAYDLSEMYIVRNAYIQKAEKYIRMHGTINFGGGSELNDVPWMIRKYGIVPETVYPGKQVDRENHIHAEMDEVLKDYLDGVLKNPDNELSPVWMQGFRGILDAYLGDVPVSFEWNGKTTDAMAFSADLGLNMDDYILLTSFTHHPFYDKFIVEVPDNWSWGEAYNVPLDELIECIDFSVMNDHPVAWATDDSEKGFSFSRGLAIVPEDIPSAESGTGKSEIRKPVSKGTKIPADIFDRPLREKTINQQIRQEAFDSYLTTDDHGMLITGIAKDQDGDRFYYAKNSWGTNNIYNGYMYISETYVRYKTLTILVNKNALPEKIIKKLKM